MVLMNVFGSGLAFSISAYSMNCEWNEKIWTCVVAVVTVISSALLLHFVICVRDGVWKQRLFFLVSTVVLFMLPIVGNPNAHFHHFFWSWLIGMQAGLHKYWWSTLCSGILWGVYLNGITQYGRDPVFGCYESLYRGLNQYCPYLQCYVDAQHPADAQDTVPAWHRELKNGYDCAEHTAP